MFLKYIQQNIYIILVVLKFYRKMQYAKSVNSTVCIPDSLIIKYFGNKTIEIK